MIIKNKIDFYRLSSNGMCGNTPKIWFSFNDYIQHKKNYPIIGLRRTIKQHKTLTPGIHYSKLQEYIKENNIKEGTYIITQIPNIKYDHVRKIQGELSWINGKWYFYYTKTGGYMRHALEIDGHHSFGMSAINLIKQNCMQNEFNQLMELFEFYTEDNNYPTIEFSITINGLLIWEIRHY